MYSTFTVDNSEVVEMTMDFRARQYPGTRFAYQAYHRYYSAQGSSSAKDYLENVSEIREPNVLILGCGDFRGCVYTLWKHFDPPSSLDFYHGVHFVLNDINPGIIARNILHLYYITLIPSWKELEAAKQWIANLWSIWYCHELLPLHNEVLKDALTVLVKSATSLESWKSSVDNPLRNLVTFTNVDTLDSVRSLWEMWLTKKVGSMDAMHTERLDKFKEKLAEVSTVGGMDAHVLPTITTFLGVLRTTDVSREELESLGVDFSEYLQTGSSYAEEVFSLPFSTNQTFINSTFFENEDGLYNLQYASAPFRSFYHILEVSKCEVQKLGMSATIAGQPLVVEDDNFQLHPLLSNCVQQFTIWVSSAAATLKMQMSRAKPDITFTFDCSNCCHFCEELTAHPKLFAAQSGFQPVFNAIYTQSLIDVVSTPVLVNSALPLLKSDGVLYTRSCIHTFLAETAAEYLDAQFGFSTELFPLMLGARCIGLEGEYSDSNANEPVPVSITTILGTIREAHQHPSKDLYWVKVNASPLKISSLTDASFLLDAMHGAIHVATVSFLAKETGLITKLGMCTESAIRTIMTFTSLLESDVDIHSPLFWEPLAARLKRDAKLQSLFVHLQTQFLLHGIHLHLVFSKDNCPLCLKVPLFNVISQFGVNIDPVPKGSPPKSSPFFIAIVHKGTLPKWLPLHQLPSLGTSVHMVDSAHGINVSDDKVFLEFLFPKLFVTENCKVSLIRYDIGLHPLDDDKDNLCLPTRILSVELKDIECKHSFQFSQAGTTRSQNNSSGLGSFLSHWGDANHMETTISLTFDALAKMKSTPMKNKRCGLKSIEVSCGDLKLPINYPYPVEFSKITTKLNKKNGTLVLKAPRLAYNFYNEQPMFIVNPDNKLVFPPLPVSNTVYSTITGMQFTRKERTTYDSTDSQKERMPPPLNIKDWVVYFLKKPNKLFTVHSRPDPKTGEKNVWLLVVIHSRVFDTVRQTPALDLSYCIMTEEIFDKVFQQWRIVCVEPSLSPSLEVIATKDDYKYFCDVLRHFTQRTHKSVKNPSHMLRKYHLDQHFIRAMVYPLYCDPERFLIEMKFASQSYDASLARQIPFPPWSSLNPANSRPNPPPECPCYPFTSTSVASSSKQNSILSANDNPSAPLSVSNDEQSMCSYCGGKSNKLKKCTGCGKTWYCGKECQSNHWKEHRAVCRSVVTQPVTQRTANVSTEPVLTRCAGCNKEGNSLKRCACHFVAYCSKDCQRNDWTRHRVKCATIRKS